MFQMEYEKNSMINIITRVTYTENVDLHNLFLLFFYLYPPYHFLDI